MNLIAHIHPVSLFETGHRPEEQRSSSIAPRDARLPHSCLLMLRPSARTRLDTWTRLHANSQEAARTREHWRARERIATRLRTFSHPFEGIYGEITGANWAVLIKQDKSQTLSSVFWFSTPSFAFGSWFSFLKKGVWFSVERAGACWRLRVRFKRFGSSRGWAAR